MNVHGDRISQEKFVLADDTVATSIVKAMEALFRSAKQAEPKELASPLDNLLVRRIEAACTECIQIFCNSYSKLSFMFRYSGNHAIFSRFPFHQVHGFDSEQIWGL